MACSGSPSTAASSAREKVAMAPATPSSAASGVRSTPQGRGLGELTPGEPAVDEGREQGRAVDVVERGRVGIRGDLGQLAECDEHLPGPQQGTGDLEPRFDGAAPPIALHGGQATKPAEAPYRV